MSKFSPGTISSDRDAEQLAARHMNELGFVDIEIQSEGEERAVDIDALDAVALVRHHAVPIGLSVVQQVRGAGGLHSQSLLYALAGFTHGALAFAEEREVALFRYSVDGAIEAQSSSARQLVEHGWLTDAPGLKTTARDDFRDAVENYAQSVIDTASQMSRAVEAVLGDLRDWEGDLGEDDQTRAHQTSRDTRILAALLEQLNGETKWDTAILIRQVQCTEALLHGIATRWGIDYSDVELDAAVSKIMRK